jgi:glyoxylase-like metal-dependent hydrolase (beta-lactamase superfamily II)
MIFRQLFEPVSSAYTYLVGCEETKQALLIDPVVSVWERDLAVVRSLGLRLAYTVDTHIHADHITAAQRLKKEAGSRIANAAMDGLSCTDVGIEENCPLEVGEIRLMPLYTPGHTASHFSYLVDDRVFTGDALLIDGCGRTDFQGGDAATLYRSIHEKLFTLPEDHLVYPAHDYQGRHVSTIGQERARNPRLGGQKSLEEFTGIMRELKLAYPKFIDYALPGNEGCGVCPPYLPDMLQDYCDRMNQSPQG